MALRRIGQILVDLGFISDDQLVTLLDEQRQHPGQLLGKLAEKLGFVTEEQLAQALAEQWGMQVIHLADTVITPAVLQYVSDMATVDDPALLRTMFYLWERLKLVVEPTGALGAAAALEGTTSIRGARVGVVLSGGNVDLSHVAEWLSAQ